jgi:hypothetical protein
MIKSQFYSGQVVSNYRVLEKLGGVGRGVFGANCSVQQAEPSAGWERWRRPILIGLLNMRSMWSRSGGIMEGAAAADRCASHLGINPSSCCRVRLSSMCQFSERLVAAYIVNVIVSESPAGRVTTRRRCTAALWERRKTPARTNRRVRLHKQRVLRPERPCSCIRTLGRMVRL